MTHKIDHWATMPERDRWHALFSLLVVMEERLMAVSAQVQAVLDKVTALETTEASVVTGLQAQAALIQNQNSEIAALQATIAAGGTIGADDLAALATIGQDIDAMNAGLQQAIPANTNTQSSGSPGPSGSTTAASAAPLIVAPAGSPNAPTGTPGSPEAAAANGPANHPAGGSAPLMPTTAFDPNPTATSASLAAGQIPSTIQTPGGFVTNPPNPNLGAPVTMGAAGDVAPTSIVPNAAGGQTVLAGQVAPGAPISTQGGVESATDADGVPLSASVGGTGSASPTSPSVSPAAAAAAGGNPNAAPFDPSAPPPASPPVTVPPASPSPMGSPPISPSNPANPPV